MYQSEVFRNAHRVLSIMVLKIMLAMVFHSGKVIPIEQTEELFKSFANSPKVLKQSPERLIGSRSSFG